MSKNKLYKAAFFHAYHKPAREGWFWRFFGMAFDQKMRDTTQQILADYQKLKRETQSQLSLDEYLDMVQRHEEEKLRGQPGQNHLAPPANMIQLDIKIVADESNFENAVATSMGAIYEHLSEGVLAHQNHNEYGTYSFSTTRGN